MASPITPTVVSPARWRPALAALACCTVVIVVLACWHALGPRRTSVEVPDPTTGVTLKVLDGGAAQLIWRTSAACRGRVRMTPADRGSAPAATVDEEGSTGEHRVTVGVIDQRTRYRFEILGSPGLTHRFPITPLSEVADGLAAAVDACPIDGLARTLTAERSFDPTLETPLRLWAVTYAPGTNNYAVRLDQRRKKAADGYWRSQVMAQLDAHGVKQKLERFRPWASEFFGARDFPIARRLHLYERLVRLQDLDALIVSQLDGSTLGIRDLYSAAYVRQVGISFGR